MIFPQLAAMKLAFLAILILRHVLFSKKLVFVKIAWCTDKMFYNKL